MLPSQNPPNLISFRSQASAFLPTLAHQKVVDCCKQGRPRAAIYSSLAPSQLHTTFPPVRCLLLSLAQDQLPSTLRSLSYAPLRVSRTHLLPRLLLQFPSKHSTAVALGKAFKQVSIFLLSHVVTERIRYRLIPCNAYPALQDHLMRCRDLRSVHSAPRALTAVPLVLLLLQLVVCVPQAHTAVHQGRLPSRPADLVPRALALPLKALPPALSVTPASIPAAKQPAAHPVQLEHSQHTQAPPLS